jgi:hypothetical protein
MDVGAIYPSMPEFRLAVRQHAIVGEFELHSEKSDKKRFRGCCNAKGCPWRIRAKTQFDSSVRVHIFLFVSCNLLLTLEHHHPFTNIGGLIVNMFACAGTDKWHGEKLSINKQS